MKKLGYFAKLYVGNGGATPTLTVANLLKLVKNVKGEGSTEQVDATDRNTEGWYSYLSGLKNYKLSGVLNWDNTNTLINLFREAWVQNKPIALFATDGNGGGVDADFVLTTWTENQNNNEALGYEFEAVINADTRVPKVYHPDPSGGSSGSAIANPTF